MRYMQYLKLTTDLYQDRGSEEKWSVEQHVVSTCGWTILSFNMDVQAISGITKA